MGKISTWWNGPCGGREVLVLAIPMIISSGTYAVMNFTDRMFLLGYDADAMTAAFQAGLLFWALLSLPQYVASYTNTFVAQYNGAKQYDNIGKIVWQGVFFGIAMIPIFLLAFPLFNSLFPLFGHRESLLPLEKTYLQILVYCSGAVIAGEAVAGFFIGREKMFVVMYVNIGCMFLNILLDYGLIFGRFGLPELGIAGAAWATTLSQTVRLLVFLVWMGCTELRDPRFAVFRSCRLHSSLMWRLIQYGGASGLQVFCDFGCFVFFTLLVGGLGQAASDATTMALTFNSFTFMPLLGTGIAVMSLVGNQLGDNKPDLAARGTMTAFLIGVSYSGIFGVAFLFFPHTILNMFSYFAGSAPMPETHAIAANLLRIVAMYLFFDGICTVFGSALKGAGDMKFVMLVTCALCPLLPVTCLLGVYVWGYGVLWCWIALMLWICLYAVVYTWRFFQGKWRNMRVIDMQR